MATTTNYGWTTPNDTDLVKNGASAIRTLGSSIDSTLYDKTCRNAVINSNFSVWQRGTSLGNGAGVNTYLADRWCAYRGAAGSTVSRQATGDTTNLPNIQYCARIQRDNTNASTSTIYYAQSFESINSILFAGKTITLSFYARAGANYSATSSNLTVQLLTGTGTDQNIISGYTGSVTAINQTATLTTTWQRFSYTATLSASLTELGLWFYYAPVGTAGANDYYEVTGVQLELGSSANTYMPNQPTYQGELAACQRYYERISPNSQNSSMAGFNNSTTVGYFTIPFKVTKRVNPTITLGSVTTDWAVRIPGGSNQQLSAYSVIGNTLDNAWLSGTATGLTSGNGNFVVNVGNNGYIEMSAEL